MPDVPALPGGEQLTRAISAAMVKLYGEVYGRGQTTASTYINDNVVVCILEDILTSPERKLVADGAGKEVIEARVAFQADRADAFTAAVEALTLRPVVGFMSATRPPPPSAAGCGVV